MQKTTSFLVIFALAILAVSSLWLIQNPELIQYIYFLRFPIIIAILLCFLPIISINVVPVLLRNLFVLRSNGQLILVMVGSVLAGMAVILVYNIILANAYLRFAVVPFSPIPELIQYLIAIILSLPIILQSISLSKTEIENTRTGKPTSINQGIFIGTISSIAIILVIFAVRHLINHEFFEQALLLGFSILPPELQQGYILPSGRLAPGITEGIGFFLVLIVIYFYAYLRLRPEVDANRFEAPALGYIPLILASIVLLLGGLSFFFDYLRVPVLPIFLLISGTGYLLANVDHFYDLQKCDLKKPDAEAWKQAINKRLEKCPLQNQTLVVVCASSGGIQAAGWTTAVLTGLQRVLGTSFIQSIAWISAVSGGSVGTMYYLDRFGENGYPEEQELQDIFNNATQDSLDAVAWGLAFPDLLRFIGLPFLVNQMEDRGTAIEIDWKGELKNKSASLNTWYQQAQEGIIPIPIFNATLVEDGRRFLISPMTLASDDHNNDCEFTLAESRSIDFNTLYPEYNIDVTTAARLSASFPYISPVCRPNKEIAAIFHVGDGGYFDNFGVSTSVELLDRFLSSDEGKDIKKVLFLQIQASSDLPISNKNSGSPGWVMEIAGSLAGVFKVRRSTQIAANFLNLRLLKKKWQYKAGVEIADFSIVFPRKFQKRYPQPLSWQLTHEQKFNILSAWNYLANYVPNQSSQDNHQEALERVIYDLKEKWQAWQGRK
ncbi:MAG TPA: hypothetical protein VK203_17060 [Nostocaceae cyanobacterium]|nr:hypothetical protein [Nostocaceae cyanobacterium]